VTQPPDDRLLPPDEPEPTDAGDEPAAPENAPTVTWSPPESGATSSEAGGLPPDETSPEAPPTEEPAPPPSPIISAAPTTPPASGWQQPGAPPPLPAAVAGGGWEMPTASAPVAQEGGYVVGGVGARIVAWLIDLVLSFIVPGAIALVILDWNALLRPIFDQIRFDASGRVISSGAITIPVTTELILIALITIGAQFLYFVGFWTSSWRATPGMIGLKMKVVDANTGAGLSMVQATKRWIAMGWPLSLLTLVPVLQNAAGLAQFGLNVFLFFSTVTNDRKQGLHDKFAGSQVIRSVTSGNGATVVGCLVYIVMVIAISIVASLAFFTVAGPALMDFIRTVPGYTE
jgi:uncharacterized RDD family membrane protein YckC